MTETTTPKTAKLDHKYVPCQMAPDKFYGRRWTCYRLDPSIADLLQKVANKSCYRCHGTGIKGWKAQGRKGVICNCIPRTASEPAQVTQVDPSLADGSNGS